MAVLIYVSFRTRINTLLLLCTFSYQYHHHLLNHARNNSWRESAPTYSKSPIFKNSFTTTMATKMINNVLKTVSPPNNLEICQFLTTAIKTNSKSHITPTTAFWNKSGRGVQVLWSIVQNINVLLCFCSGKAHTSYNIVIYRLRTQASRHAGGRGVALGWLAGVVALREITQPMRCPQ